MDIFLKAAAGALVTVILCLTLAKQSKDMALLLTITVCSMVIVSAVSCCRPLLDFLDSGTDFTGFSAADKVIGKATAFLYCLLGVRAVYAQVMSTNAAQVLAAHGISAFCTRLVTGIRNRTDTGPCPMEAATRDLTDPEEALAAIRRTLHNLQQA